MTNPLRELTAMCGIIASVSCATAGQPSPGPAQTVGDPGRAQAVRARVPAPSELAARALSNGDHGVIASKVLSEEREFLVYKPPSYADADKKYPVLYLLDGEAHFQHVAGLVAFLADAGRIPPMIVVGVINTVRNRDLTPSRVRHISNSGGADNFIRFLKTELVPAVDARYRTHSYRILAGHSFGGLFVTHALIEHPSLFDAYLAMSPTLDWGNGVMLARAKARWEDSTKLNRFFYFTLGEEPEGITASNEAFAAFLREKAPMGLVWSFQLMKGEDHMSTPHRSVYNGLVELFAGLRMPEGMNDAAAIEAHYRALSERFRFPLQPSRGALTDLGYRLLGEDRNQQAIAVFQLFVSTYPKSPNAYDSLGEALEKTGQLERALDNYEQAVEHAAAMEHQLLEIFVRNRDRLRAQLGRAPR